MPLARWHSLNGRALMGATILLVIGLATSLPAIASPTGARSKQISASLSWHSCDGDFECSSLKVPISYKRAGAGSLQIAVVRLPATNKHPIGDLVLNPGGPGGSGVDFLEQDAASFPAEIRSRFDLVSFDPRGVDRSDPVQCVSAAQTRQLMQLDPSPVSNEQINQVVSATKAFVAGCVAHTSRSVLANVGTATTVQDLDRLRAALGQNRLDYFGLSYGTYIGELYAQRFPTRVGEMVLDGAIDPSLSTTTAEIEQAVGFETDLHDFFTWCDHDASCAAELPGGASLAFGRLFTSFNNGSTVQADLKTNFGGVQPVGLGMGEIGVAGALYTPRTWPELGQAISEALRGNGNILAELAYEYEGVQPNGQFSNAQAANVAINCLDLPAPTSLSTYRALAARFGTEAPQFGASEAWGTLPCAYWPFPATGHPQSISAPKAATILVIGSTDDPATPYAWAKSIAKQLKHAVLLTRSGAGHTGYFLSTCIQTWTDRYLLNSSLPPANTICPTNA